MKKCSNTKCNREFSDDMVFCPYCGTKWKPMKRVCPNPDCRFDDIPEGANFCPNCQWDLRKETVNDPKEENVESDSDTPTPVHNFNDNGESYKKEDPFWPYYIIPFILTVVIFSGKRPDVVCLLVQIVLYVLSFSFWYYRNKGWIDNDEKDSLFPYIFIPFTFSIHVFNDDLGEFGGLIVIVIIFLISYIVYKNRDRI